MKTMQDAVGNLSRLQALIDASELDAVVAVSPENVLYAGDVFISTQVDIRDRLAFVVWAKGRAPAYVLCQVEEGYVRQESWIDDIRTYKEFVTSPIDVLADTLDEFGLARGRVGIETEYLGVRYHQKLMMRLPGLRLEPCDDLFAQARMIKSQREREILAAGFRGTEKALMETYTATRVGDTERDMAFRLCDGILRSGAQSVAFCHINAGRNTGFPHMDPSDNKVAADDILKADAGGFYHRYYSNVGRTAKKGKLTDDDRSWWGRLREIHHEITDMVRPGNTGAQLFEAATRLHKKHEIPFPYAHNGHGIGLQVHEHPLISPHDTTPIEAGMMITVETRVRWVGKKGYHMEDLIEVTERAPIVRSDFFDNETILVV